MKHSGYILRRKILTETIDMYQHLLASTPFFEVKIAEYLSEVESALKLRFKVFNLELHQGLESSYETGFDSDVYDTFCDHLIVKDRQLDKVVGTYRLLRQEKAENNFGFYSENEFDLTRIKKLGGHVLELGRSCVAKEYRSLAVVNLLWVGIARYIEIHNISAMFGCASFHTNNENEISQAFAYLKRHHFAPDDFRVFPLERMRNDVSQSAGRCGQREIRLSKIFASFKRLFTRRRNGLRRTGLRSPIWLNGFFYAVGNGEDHRKIQKSLLQNGRGGVRRHCNFLALQSLIMEVS